MNLKSCTAGCVFVYTFLSGGLTFSPPVCRWCWPHLAPEQISVRLFTRTNIETSVLLCWQAGWEASRRPADGVAICSEMSLAHLCFDPDLLSACLLAPAGISVKPGQSLAASRGPSSLSRASLLHRHDGKTSKQFIQATLNSFLSSETFLLSGSRIHFRLVGSRIVSGNFKWLSCVYSAVISVHSGSGSFLCYPALFLPCLSSLQGAAISQAGFVCSRDWDLTRMNHMSHVNWNGRKNIDSFGWGVSSEHLSRQPSSTQVVQLEEQMSA